ncbi:hypothetical protein H1R20_g12839, partial [Candolleomyces eurysporus]
MTTDFWASSHYKRWIVDRATLRQARAKDREYVNDPEHLDFLAIFFANVITKLGKKLQLRQRVIATATVFFRRFYLKNKYCETDPFIVIPACIYVAAKAEESPVHIKNVISESRSLFSQTYGIKTFPSDNSKLAEMEFYLVDDLECDMVVYHPYRTLLALCKKEASNGEEGEEGEAEEAGELGTGIGAEDGPSFWGSGHGKLVLSEEAFQTTWSIINDTYRSELCLLYPPHLIAIAALYLTFVLHPPDKITSKPSSPEDKPQPRRSSRQANNNSSNINFSALATVGHTSSTTSSLAKFKPPPSLPAKPVTSFAPPPAPSNPPPNLNLKPDPITFLAQLNVSLPLVATIVQEIISLYTLWDRYKDEATPESTGISITSLSRSNSMTEGKSNKGKSRTIPIDSPMEVDDSNATTPSEPDAQVVTPSFLIQILAGMRESRLLDLCWDGEGELVGLPPGAANAAAMGGYSQGDTTMNMNMGYGAPPYAPINKVLERAMNAGYG